MDLKNEGREGEFKDGIVKEWSIKDEEVLRKIEVKKGKEEIMDERVLIWVDEEFLEVGVKIVEEKIMDERKMSRKEEGRGGIEFVKNLDVCES